MSDHVHDCTGPDATCPCGHKFTVPRFAFSVEVYDGETQTYIVNEGFSSDTRASVAYALREAADKLERMS